VSRELEGLAAVVTGAGSGIGLAVATAFVADGAQVAALDREPAELEGALVLAADVTSQESLDEAVAAAVTSFGSLDVLVNNAGIGATGTVEETADDQWHRLYDVNVVGIARACRAALPHLRRSARASIVNVASIVAEVGLPRRAAYSASKGAVLALTRAMAADLVADGIRVNCVCPATVDTPWVQRLLAESGDPAAERRALAARQPLGRLAAAEEIAATIAFLASPASGFTTGAAYAVDGGLAGLRLPIA
jgi:2-keto-3-deoxy-L-fuconate dehydrogenase